MKKKVILPLALLASALAGCATTTGAEGEYTYRAYTAGSPTNWNPHTWEDNSYDDIATYTEIGFADFTYDPDNKGGYKISYEMATAINDVTKDKSIVTDTFKQKWDIIDGQEGRVWKIDLRENAKFASGTVINADTYIESMKLLLDHTLKNYRANNYYSSDSSLSGAFVYYNATESSLTSMAQIPTKGVTVDDTEVLDWANSPL